METQTQKVSSFKISDEKFRLITDHIDRGNTPVKGFCREHGITAKTYYHVKKYWTEHGEEDRCEDVLAKLYADSIDERNTSAARTQAAKVYLQAKGRLVEKTEQNIRIDLSGDDIARIIRKTGKALSREAGRGVVPVQPEPHSLPQASCQDTGCQQGEDGEVGAVAVPD